MQATESGKNRKSGSGTDERWLEYIGTKDDTDCVAGGGQVVARQRANGLQPEGCLGETLTLTERSLMGWKWLNSLRERVYRPSEYSPSPEFGIDIRVLSAHGTSRRCRVDRN